jgi:hypothetical protein
MDKHNINGYMATANKLTKQLYTTYTNQMEREIIAYIFWRAITHDTDLATDKDLIIEYKTKK